MRNLDEQILQEVKYKVMTVLEDLAKWEDVGSDKAEIYRIARCAVTLLKPRKMKEILVFIDEDENPQNLAVVRMAEAEVNKFKKN